MNREALINFSRIAQSEIEVGAVEDRLRHLFSAHLVNIFPERPWWVQEHVLGTETYLHFTGANGNERSGFADSIVGKTAIEYEKNLSVPSIFDEGYFQVREYCAALYNIGIPAEDIRGVLSDTIKWYGYEINIIGNVEQNHLLGAEDVELIQRDYVDLSNGNDAEITKYESFVNKYFAREESRLLTGPALSLAFGTESIFYSEHIHEFENVVTRAMEDRPIYGELIKNLWQNFVAFLGASDFGNFSINTYVNEFYLVTVAKIICANILNGRPLLSSSGEIKNILTGIYFKQRNITNLVDYDYFGWLNNSPYVEQIVASAVEIQKQLLCFDFNLITEQDLFGELLVALSKKEHRLLLGQDFTPHWVARDMVKEVIDNLESYPRMLDMCCGSGVFLIETINYTRQKYDIKADNYSDEKDNIAFSCVMGFDIDPLAIMLAKVNWVMSLRDLFSIHHGAITIPIYHADSLFVATPVSHNASSVENDCYSLFFDGNRVDIPAYMLSARHRKTFDAFLLKCYGMAMTRASGDVQNLSDAQLDSLLLAIQRETNIEQTDDESLLQRLSAYALVSQLERLQREGRNGIWYFILNNSYRPGLVENQFNCIISNPPWMAMSKLAENPYKHSLEEKNERMGIKPPGASHLHMELATTFLLSSIEKYLESGGRWTCVMPGSVLSGYNHEPFRKAKYIDSEQRISTNIDLIWELPITTFKNKAIVLGGMKSDEPIHYPISGRNYLDAVHYTTCEYTMNTQGSRSAWTNRGIDTDVIDLINSEPWAFIQGADIFPRTALFHNFLRNRNGTWQINAIENTSNLYYLINDSKKNICGNLVSDGFSNQFMYDCFISKHLSPFVVSNPAKVLLPGYKNENGWNSIDDNDLALMDTASSAIFEEIQENIGIPLATYLNDKINIYGKLFKQDFSLGRWLVLSNAGGANPCAAYLDLNGYDRAKLVIDQTLYWYIAENEDEAIFITALINSEALNVAIKDFQPDGGFGKRHIHTLPYKVIPQFDSDNDLHMEVVETTRALVSSWLSACACESIGQYMNPTQGTLNSRRRRQQEYIKTLGEYSAYDRACRSILGIE